LPLSRIEPRFHDCSAPSIITRWVCYLSSQFLPY
jgi:hypothetical protein